MSGLLVMGPARDLYVTAARGMGAFDENRALAALVRAESRRQLTRAA